MNVKQMLVPSVLTTILFVTLFAANAAAGLLARVC